MIQVEGVSKTFIEGAPLTVLRDVSFEVQKGKALVILGQSGSGKSVLLKILAQLLDPDQGRVEILSTNIGMVFQKNALFDSLTVEENLKFAMEERGGVGARTQLAKIAKFLEWVGLSHATKLMPNELSGGMQKRLAIARALIVQPEVLLYDEPTAGLDPITSRMIADLMLKLKAEFGTTIVCVTSDVLRAYQLGDQIGLLTPHMGRARAGSTFLNVGTPEEARTSRDPLFRQFLDGLTKGPLTHATEDMEALRHELLHDIVPPAVLNEKLREFKGRWDVDYF